LQNAFSQAAYGNKEARSPRFPSTARIYSHRQQQRRIRRRIVGELLITIILCTTYFVIVYCYHLSDSLSSTQIQVFNLLSTSNATLLGINLTACLQSYVKILR